MTPLRKSLFVAALFAFGTAAASSEDVSVEHNGVTLHGTLLLPENENTPKAAVLIIAGSGPTDRDGNSPLLPGANNSLRYLAEALADNDIASLRYDKRMVGKSVSADLTEAELRFDHYADDAAALLNVLRVRFPDTPLLIAGHSEGGHIALTTAPEAKPDALIVLAGPGQHPADLIEKQLAAQLPGPLLEESRGVLEQLRAGQLVEKTPPLLDALFRKSVQPYLVSWFQYDPQAQIEALKLPILLVYGTGDVQVPATDGELLKAAQPNATLVTIEGMNHVLKDVRGDSSLAQTSYSDPALPLDPRLTKSLVAFVDELD
ncbi:MAG: alpha/beta fold hydrolase [Pseudomonadota bacterium]